MNDAQADGPTELENAATPPTEEAPAESLGERFRHARVAQGLSLETLSAQLKITPRKITAIEEGRFADLPQGPYLRGIIRNYAKALQLDPAAAVEAFERAIGPVSRAADFSLRPALGTPFSQRPASSRDSSLGRFMLTATIALIVVAIFITWSGTTSFKTATAMISSLAANGTVARVHRVTLTPAANSAAATALRSTPVSDQDASQNRAVQPAIASQTLTPPSAPSTDDTASSSQSSEENTVASANVSAGTSTESTATDGGRAAAITLRFQDDSWVEIKQADGKVLLSQEVSSGSQKSLEGSPPFEIIIGNAPGTTLEYHGSAIDLTPYTHDRVARLTLK